MLWTRNCRMRSVLNVCHSISVPTKSRIKRPGNVMHEKPPLWVLTSFVARLTCSGLGKASDRFYYISISWHLMNTLLLRWLWTVSDLTSRWAISGTPRTWFWSALSHAPLQCFHDLPTRHRNNAWGKSRDYFKTSMDKWKNVGCHPVQERFSSSGYLFFICIYENILGMAYR